MNNHITKTLLSTLFALFAFAGNSVLCRMALGTESIDATSFTIIRLVSGAIALLAIIIVVGQNDSKQKGLFELSASGLFEPKKWLSASMLFVYAAGFSFAYIEVDTGVGALVLFSTVQISMISVSIYRKDALPWYKWMGLLLALSGLCFLILSQLDFSSAKISSSGFILMIIAGIAWAAYTLLGRASTNPVIDTGTSFILSSFLCIPLVLAYWFLPMSISKQGLYLALASGFITSALGYAIWYYALRGLSRIQAGVVQLFVPVIAAFGGLIWVNESISNELIVAQILVLGGIVLVMLDSRTKKKTALHP